MKQTYLSVKLNIPTYLCEQYTKTYFSAQPCNQKQLVD